LSEIMDNHRLAARIIAKRGKRGLRAAASEVGGISASTLSRVEAGSVPDLDTFLRLCRWLEASPEEFTGGPVESQPREEAPRVEAIAAHLRADRTLDRETARALERMVRLAYDAAASGRLVEDDGE
jgi:transcriptional regulator with XRE-family HTH domain